ncbi:MAG TPA: DUF1569 domain-containing protein [Cytophaga sp.]|nr:DUF1569 domain-containing protein [Cytophaga sp.]
MKSLFDNETYNEVKQRLNNLTEQSQRQWGKMEPAQMLAHCKEAFKVPLSDTAYPRMFLGRIMGWMMKSKLYNDSAWGKGMPTAPDFIIKDQRNFQKEKQELIALIDKMHAVGPDKVGNYPHPFFGTFTKPQWGQSMYKHLDHHLRQFGA